MFGPAGNTVHIKTTSYKVVLPFYLYAALSFLLATLLLFLGADSFTGHYFQPHILAITHLMALGWGTMIILGASHQLVPVLIEGKLFSDKLAYWSFGLAGIGIPILIYCFLSFNMGMAAEFGGSLIVAAVIVFLVNLSRSMHQSGSKNIHSAFVLSGTIWLLITVLIGLLLVCNFNEQFLSLGSLHYLALHAHLGIVGWFLLVVIGVGSRLIPLFLISKYNNTKLLKTQLILINVALISFIVLFLLGSKVGLVVPAMLVVAAVLMFGYYCYHAYKGRIRKSVDAQVKVSLLSVGMIALPLVFLLLTAITIMLSPRYSTRLATTYGFFIFFGWITAIILGMTFKTLPFIIWNKVYGKLSGSGKTPNPKDLFSGALFNWMAIAYLAGLVVFGTGITMSDTLLLKVGSLSLLASAVFYNLNVFIVSSHKPLNNGSNNKQ